MAFFFFATETLDELSDWEDILRLPGLTAKREENNRSIGVGGKIPLIYRVKGIECKKSAKFLHEGGD